MCIHGHLRANQSMPEKSRQGTLGNLRKPFFAVAIAPCCSLSSNRGGESAAPRFRGVAGVCIACSLFFQVMLLAG